MYILHLGCYPGACRKNDYYVSSSLEQVYTYLTGDLSCNPYLLLWYGMKIKLYMTSIDGVEQLDLHDYISVTWKNNIYNVDTGGIIGYEFSEEYIDDNESGMLFENNGGEVQGSDIIFSDIPLTIHLNLPQLDPISTHPVPDDFKLPRKEGYHDYD